MRNKILSNLLLHSGIFFCLLFLATIITTSCKRSGMGYVKGTVLNIVTGDPIEGIKVYVTDTKYGSTHNNNTGSAITDSNGNYEIKYYKKISHKYYIRVENTSSYISESFKGIEFKKFAYPIVMYPR